MSRCIRSMLTLLILVLLFGVVPSPVPGQNKNPSQTVQFPSVNGEPSALVGHLRRPNGPGPFPAIVLLHGCAGDWQGMDSRWGARLVEWGYVALSVNSFGPRGIKSLCGNGGDPSDRVFDAHGALDFLAEQPFVAPDRGAVMGVSSGGTVALRDVEQGSLEQSADRKFRAAVALYPQCGAITEKMAVPTLILIGQLDDLTPAKNCQDLASGNPLGVSRNGPKDENIRLIVLPGAYHAFDNTSFPKGQYFLGSHWLEYNADATKRSVSEIRQFLRDSLGD